MALKHSLIGASIGLVAALAGCDEQGVVVSNEFCPESRRVYIQPSLIVYNNRTATGKLPILAITEAERRVTVSVPGKGEKSFYVPREDSGNYKVGAFCSFDSNAPTERLVKLRRLGKGEFESGAWKDDYGMANMAGYDSKAKGRGR